MTSLPASFVDFSSALSLLANSQADITELVSKWSDIMDTTTPKTVDVGLSDGEQYMVDNLAKIRADLIAGLSLDEPTVKAIHFSGYRTTSTLMGTLQYGKTWHPADSYDFDPLEGYTAIYSNDLNTFRTACVPKSDNLSVMLLDMPRIVLLGSEVSTNIPIIDDVTITVSAPPASLVSSGTLAENKYYCGITTFVNRNFGTQAGGINSEGNPVKLTLASGDVTLSTIEIPPTQCISVLMFAAAGGSIVHIHPLSGV